MIRQFRTMSEKQVSARCCWLNTDVYHYQSLNTPGGKRPVQYPFFGSYFINFLDFENDCTALLSNT